VVIGLNHLRKGEPGDAIASVIPWAGGKIVKQTFKVAGPSTYLVPGKVGAKAVNSLEGREGAAAVLLGKSLTDEY